MNDVDLDTYEGLYSTDSKPKEYKSVYLRCAEARGGPIKFRRRLKELKARKSPSNMVINWDGSTPKDVLLTATAPAKMGGDPYAQESFSLDGGSVQESLAPSVLTEGSEDYDKGEEPPVAEAEREKMDDFGQSDYDGEEFVTTMGSNKYRLTELAPVEEANDESVAGSQEGVALEVEAAAEEEKEEENEEETVVMNELDEKYDREFEYSNDFASLVSGEKPSEGTDLVVAPKEEAVACEGEEPREEVKEEEPYEEQTPAAGEESGEAGEGEKEGGGGGGEGEEEDNYADDTELEEANDNDAGTKSAVEDGKDSSNPPDNDFAEIDYAGAEFETSQGDGEVDNAVEKKVEEKGEEEKKGEEEMEREGEEGEEEEQYEDDYEMSSPEATTRMRASRKSSGGNLTGASFTAEAVPSFLEGQLPAGTFEGSRRSDSAKLVSGRRGQMGEEESAYEYESDQKSQKSELYDKEEDREWASLNGEVEDASSCGSAGNGVEDTAVAEVDASVCREASVAGEVDDAELASSSVAAAEPQDDEEQYLVDFDEENSDNASRVSRKGSLQGGTALEDSMEESVSAEKALDNHPLDENLSQSPSRIEQIDFDNIVGPGSSSQSGGVGSPGSVVKGETVKDNYIGE